MANIIPDRDKRILDAALELAKGLGFEWITRDQVATAAGVSPATINNVFGTVSGMKRAVLREAIAREVVEIVAQGLAVRHPIALAAPTELKERAVAHMVAA